MSTSALRRVLYPKRVAIIGASADPESAGGRIARAAIASIRARDSGIALYLVNPHHDSLYGEVCLRTIAALPADIDLALIATPWSQVSQVLRDLNARDVANAVCISVATESGWPWESRTALLNKLERQLRRGSLRWIGPASPGLALCQQGINLSLCDVLPRAGNIAYVGQSDAVASVLCDWAAQHGTGFSHMLTLGDELDVKLPEVLDLLVQDSATRAVLIYIDQLKAIPDFFSALRALAYQKPVAVLCAGLASSAQRALWNALVQRCGAFAVDNLEQLCSAANLDFPSWPKPLGRFAIIGNSSALLRLAQDAVQNAGFPQAALSKAASSALKKHQAETQASVSVIHLGRDAGPRRYVESSELLLAQDAVDVVLLVHHTTAFADSKLIAAALAPIVERKAPLLMALVGPQQADALKSLIENGVAAFATPEAAVRAYQRHALLNQLKRVLTATPDALEYLPDTTRARWLSLRMTSRSAEDALPDLLAPLHLTALQAELAACGLRIRLECDSELGRYLALQALGVIERIPLPVTAAHAMRALAFATSSGIVVEAMVRMSDWAMVAPELVELVLDAHSARWTLDAKRTAIDVLSAPRADFDWFCSASGQRLLCRDIRAEDEPALTRGFTRLSPEEVRMRFMYPLKHLTHELAARLTQLDYHREIALVLASAEPPGRAEIFGVVRASLDMRLSEAEFAIVIPSALSGQGFGKRLMQEIMARCAARGIKSIYGDVLAENDAMLRLARALGFSVLANPHDAHQLRVQKAL
jgi:acetyltransferase